MRNYFTIMSLIVTSVLLSACPSKIETPTIQPPKIPDFGDVLKGMKTCTKKESDQTFSSEATQNTVVVEDQIESKDIEYIDCDGNVKSKGHGPTRTVQKIIPLPAPQNFPAGLSFVEIENARTCSVNRIDAKDDKDLQDEFELPDGRKISMTSILTKVGQSGAINLSVTDSNFKLFVETNITDGANVVQIRYFGKCIQYRADKNEKLGESYNCQKAELLATKDMVIDLRVNRPEAAGVQKVDQCLKKRAK